MALSAGLELSATSTAFFPATNSAISPTWSDHAERRDLRDRGDATDTNRRVRFLSRPGDFQRFAKGEVAAFDGADPILAPFDGAMPVWIKQTIVAGEQAFMWAREIGERTR